MHTSEINSNYLVTSDATVFLGGNYRERVVCIRIRIINNCSIIIISFQEQKYFKLDVMHYK
eukprot:snap_masked-scaffold_8-processed-gene-12.44-mRNA-1 protein AED:1.00 eAED:1.00 QI:0/0/0/0/1/1/2/0/60